MAVFQSVFNRRKKVNLLKFLYWKDNIKTFMNDLKYTYYIKYRGKCPNCRSDKLHFVEGSNKFKKWFCTFCCTMSYAFNCPHCRKDVLQYSRFKDHIYKEYRIGKWADNSYFYTKCQKDYFKQLIKFHRKAEKLWRERYEEWKKRHNNSFLYGKG